MSDRVAPKLSVITPSYNQGRYIERTIRSVLDQGYPDLEYVIVDGGSTDETVEVIRRYEDRLAWWVSEPDEGQSHAINKGIEGTSGEIVAYINSDDYYLPGAFETAVGAFERSGAGWVAGGALDVEEGDPPKRLRVWRPEPPSEIAGPLPGRHWWLLAPWHLPQPSVFWRRALLQRYGPFRQDMSNAFDAELMVRLAIAGEMPALLPNDVLATRLGHAGQKSRGLARSRAEIRRFAELFGQQLTEVERRRLALLRWPLWGWRAAREVIVDPVMRLGGRLLERLPTRLRPRIRGRDRRSSLAQLRRYR